MKKNTLSPFVKMQIHVQLMLFYKNCILHFRKQKTLLILSSSFRILVERNFGHQPNSEQTQFASLE